MNSILFISITAALLSLFLSAWVLIRDWRSFVHRMIAFGMITLAIEAIFDGLSFQAYSSAEIFCWYRLKTMAESFLPGIWLLFALAFGRENYKEIISRWRWIWIAAFIAPVVLATFFGKFSLTGAIDIGEASLGLFLLDGSGYGFNIVFLLVSVLILLNLERTFRASSGAIRWRIKFMILGVGSIFAARIYTSSQALLYSSIHPEISFFNEFALIMGNILIGISLIRSWQSNMTIYLSKTFLYNSIIILIVGIYLLTVGILAKVISYLSGSYGIHFVALFIFLTLMGLTVFLLSDEMRQRIRELISRHLKRPQYDYRQEWRQFTNRTSSLIEIRNLSTVVAKMIAEIFGVSSVSIWLLDEAKEKFAVSGSTVFSDGQGAALKLPDRNAPAIISDMEHKKMHFDFSRSEDGWVNEFKSANPVYFHEDRIRYAVPLTISGKFLGLLTLNGRITGRSFSLEDFDLLKTIADQTAANLLNLKLSERLREMKELEAFQSISSFIMHDLKNLASTLSLTMQNLPLHFDNAEFRKDAVRITQQSLSKISGMCAGLSSLSQKMELRKTKVDLNGLLTTSFSTLNGCHMTSLIQNLHPVPKLFIDPEQVQKVFTNLILNANEAVGSAGEVRVTTEHKDGWVILSVSDNGCGMSREFIERSLFRPFKTTKKQGMGIGLFQSKKIIEAHGGRIEAESEEGRGSTFRVMLPTDGK